MNHGTALLATIAAGIGLAFVLGFLATRVRLPPIVGYLVAGIIVGPFTPGFVADTGLASQLSEIGVILLMFGVGIHFSLDDLLAVRRIALPGAVAQIVAATVLGALVSWTWGWSFGSGVVFGLCLSVASTVVLLRALEDRGMIDSVDGRIAIGWLIVEDLVTVLVLVLLPTLALALGGEAGAAEGVGGIAGSEGAAQGGWLRAVAWTVAKIAAFIVLMLVVGRRAVPWLLQQVARTGSRELFTLSVLAVALGTALGAAHLFHVSFALGAFFAGMVVNGSDLSHEAATEALPLQDAFAVLFFVAVGMLFDPAILVRQPLEVAMVVLIVMVGKSIAAFLIVVAFRFSVTTALTIAASLAQIGEFSFILAALAASLGLLPPEGQSLIVAGALISIALNPVTFAGASWVRARPELVRKLSRASRESRDAPPPAARELRDHAIVVGCGRVGGIVAETLRQRAIPVLVIEQDRERADAARERGLDVLLGNAARPGMLRAARVESASLIVIAVPDPFQARAILDQALAANSTIDTVARTHSETEKSYLERHGVRLAINAERELALGLAHHALVRMGCSEDQADTTVDEVRHRRAGGAVAGPS